MREKWTDERMDDLNHRVDEGFRESREEMRALRTESREEMRALRAEMNSRFDAIDARFEAVDSRFDAMQRTMLQAAVVLSAAYLTGFAALIGLIATQL